MYWGNRQVSSSGATRYLSPGSASITAPLGPMPVRVLTSRNVRRISVKHGTGRGNGKTLRYRLLVNGASLSTDLYVDLASTSSGEAEQRLDDLQTIPAGATLDIEVTKPDGSVQASPLDVSVTVELI